MEAFGWRVQDSRDQRLSRDTGIQSGTRPLAATGVAIVDRSNLNAEWSRPAVGACFQYCQLVPQTAPGGRSDIETIEHSGLEPLMDANRFSLGSNRILIVFLDNRISQLPNFLDLHSDRITMS